MARIKANKKKSHEQKEEKHNYVPFTPVDVCFELGLQITTELVSLQDDIECIVNHLFQEEDITMVNIVEKLKFKQLISDKHALDFCRLYIIVFVVFYFFSHDPHCQ